MTELCNIDLIESLASALETMAFVAVMPPEGPIDPPNDPVLVPRTDAMVTAVTGGYSPSPTPSRVGIETSRSKRE